MSRQPESNHTVDFIIIGQGLAGSILAHQLFLRGKTVYVIDDDHFQSSTKVAAGIINPITGPRLSLTNNFNEYYPRAKDLYTSLEKIFKSKLWQELPQHRSIRNQTQLEFHDKRIHDINYLNSLGGKITSPYFDNELSVIEVFQSAVIDTKNLITKTQNWLMSLNSYQSSKLNYQKIKIINNGFAVNGIQAHQIVFCEGYQAIHNPWLKHLPFKLSKGEILTIDTDLPSTHLLNWGNWLTPVGSSAKLGSNYQWDDLSHRPSQLIKSQLLDSLHTHTCLKGRVTNHEVGIRPTTRQRTPFIGPITNLTGAYCFNGFGSKGCLLIPHYVDVFCEYLLNNTPLDKDLTQWL